MKLADISAAYESIVMLALAMAEFSGPADNHSAINRMQMEG
jgi:hypothetical protein